MTSRQSDRFDLNPNETTHRCIQASCIDAALPIPNSNDAFLEVTTVHDALADFFKATEDEDPMTVQAGVWAISDRLSRLGIKRKLNVTQEDGTVRSAISDLNLDHASRHLNQLSIKHRLGYSWIGRMWSNLH